MAKETIKQVVKLVNNFLSDRDINADKVLIFGSYAAGTYDENSDIDIAIVSRDFEGKDTFQRAEMLEGLHWFLVERFKLPFDIVSITLKEWQKSSSLLVDFIKETKPVSL